MSRMELMEISRTELRKMVGDLYAPVEVTPGEVEYVKVSKQSLLAVLTTNRVERVQVGVERYSYRDAIVFIEGVTE